MDYAVLPNSERDTRIGPVTHSRFAGPLRATVRASSATLGVTGMVALTAALWMYITYHRTGYNPPGPSVVALTEDPTRVSGPWMAYALATIGSYLVLTAATGFLGLSIYNRRRLFVHIIMLSFLVVLEAGTMLMLFTDNAWRSRIPDDPFWPRVKEYIESHEGALKIVGLVVILAQMVVGLGPACWLHSVYVAAYEDWLDGVETRQARAIYAFERAAEQAYAGSGPGAATWATRMQRKYGYSSE